MAVFEKKINPNPKKKFFEILFVDFKNLKKWRRMIQFRPQIPKQ